MPAFNAEKTISESIDSVLAQTFTNFELVICDDSSTDKTRQLINEYLAKDKRVRLVSNLYANGAAGARNSCIFESSGRYIAFLDSDDIWLPDKLKVQHEFMKSNGYALTHGSYEMFDESGFTKIISAPHKISFKDLLRKCDIGCLSVMFDKTKFDDIFFPYCPKEDYAFWLKLTKNSDVSSFSYIGVLARYRKQSTSLSSSKIKEIPKQWYVLRFIAGINRTFSMFYLFTYCFNGIFKHKK